MRVMAWQWAGARGGGASVRLLVDVGCGKLACICAAGDVSSLVVGDASVLSVGVVVSDAH